MTVGELLPLVGEFYYIKVRLWLPDRNPSHYHVLYKGYRNEVLSQMKHSGVLDYYWVKHIWIEDGEECSTIVSIEVKHPYDS